MRQSFLPCPWQLLCIVSWHKYEVLSWKQKLLPSYPYPHPTGPRSIASPPIQICTASPSRPYGPCSIGTLHSVPRPLRGPPPGSLHRESQPHFRHIHRNSPLPIIGSRTVSRVLPENACSPPMCPSRKERFDILEATPRKMVSHILCLTAVHVSSRVYEGTTI
jgi:hypothetical protein